MHNTIRLRPGSAPLIAPAPPCLPGRVIVRRVHGCVLDALFTTAANESWMARLRRRYPRGVRKVAAYVRTEGPAQTWTKIRSRVELERLDATAAFAVVGTVASDGSGLWSVDTPVMCWGWQGAIDADFYLVSPEQCLPVPALRSSYALAPLAGWIASVLRATVQDIGACEIAGLDGRLRAPLEELLGVDRERGRRVVIGCGGRQDAGAGTVFVRLSAERAINPLIERDNACVTARMPDPSHYVLDPYGPRALEWPEPFGKEAVQRALDILIARETSDTAADGNSPGPRIPIVASSQRLMLRTNSRRHATAIPVSSLGAGNYVRAVLLHQLQRVARVHVRGVMDIRPEVASRQARAMGADFCTTTATDVIEDADTRLVLIASDHASHARYAIEALRAGKAVHLEKPPAVTRDDLDALVQQLESSPPWCFHLGYNRPFAPAVVDLQSYLQEESGPTTTLCTVHGYRLGRAHWYRWPNQGTRVAGNLVHWIDLGYRLGGRKSPARVEVQGVDGPADARECITLVVGFDDGGETTVRFSAGEDDTYGIRESIVTTRGNLRATIDDFRRLTVERSGRRWQRSYARDKGHAGNITALVTSMLRPSWDPQTIADLRAVGAVQIAAEHLLRAGGGRASLA